MRYTIEECTREDGMIDLAKYTGVDDSKFAVKFGFVEKIIDNGFFEGKGPVIGISHESPVSDEERQRRRDAICEFGGVIAHKVALRELEEERKRTS